MEHAVSTCQSPILSQTERLFQQIASHNSGDFESHLFGIIQLFFLFFLACSHMRVLQFAPTGESSLIQAGGTRQLRVVGGERMRKSVK